ncbi:N-acetylglucosamine-1-phosphotransferase subunits alpha/beta [Diabrotica virgifera virgifera]|uniref:N-acetylglucosamine-1-phosphotransferase subunits alpha/beta n=1 Tax=Diabrotica virgifera virgifera TaxID=50390 RepID=A0ABM5IRR3_DIAVI|nr:N-acetylglucosamine-1-phosphotransferase subunits alpha/beta [Diabrotica virgifera virgifera]
MVVIFRLKRYFFIRFIFLLSLSLFLVIFIYHIFEIFDKVYSSSTKNCQYNENIDVVYTWVNGSDPEFLRNLNGYLKDHRNITCDASKQRFDDKYELKFSLRSLEKYAPWINHVYIVTNGQIPYWLNLDYEKVTIVTHEDIFKDVSNLPTFSSPAIECNLHRIPGLSKKFIYFNDDIFLGSPLYLDDFYTGSKGFLIYLAWAVPNCAPNCLWMYVNDGQCDKDCYRPECQMDGSDCDDFEEQRKLLFDLTTEALEDKHEENETRNIALQETIEKVQTNFYRSFLKKLNNYSESINRSQISLNLPKNISLLVKNHNKKVITTNRLKRRSRRRRGTYKSKYFERSKHCKSIDAYSASLQHTNRAFNKKYGFQTRKVPAHAPILIDKEIMHQLEEKFKQEFVVTETNRVRKENDMQFSFSYYHFIISEKKSRGVGEIFDEFDTDGSMTWSDREIRTLLTQIYELPLSYTIVDHFEEILMNCSEHKQFPEIHAPLYERYIDSKLPTITKYLIEDCQHLSNILLERFEKVFQYNFELVPSSENKYVHFTMLNSNISDVVGNLDEIRRNKRKFVCLNDNLDESKSSENELVRAILYDFYLSLFPRPSKFELPQELRNKFLYMEELKTWKHNGSLVRLALYSFLFVILCFTVYNNCKKKCCQIVNKIFC